MGRKIYSKIDLIPAGRAPHTVVPGCLVLEGGAFRGLYNQGVLDAFMENGLNLQCTIGVSAGALAGMNYVAGQIGRSARANLSSRTDRNYIGTGAIRKSHSLIRLDFLLEDYNAVEPIDRERFYDPERRYVAVATDLRTGKPLFCEQKNCKDMKSAIKASASMPYVSPAVDVDGVPCLDGGCSVKIPYQWAIDQGYEKIVIIKTRENGFRKPMKSKKTAHRFYRHNPEFADALDSSDARYNHECDEIDQLGASGRAWVLAPSEPVTVKRVEKNLDKLGNLYWLGYQDAMDHMEDLKAYLEVNGGHIRG